MSNHHLDKYIDNTKNLQEIQLVSHASSEHAHTGNCACGHNHSHEESSCGCGCGCGHDHSAKEGNKLHIFLIRLFLSFSLLMLIEFTSYLDNFSFIFYVVAYLLAGFEVVSTAIKNIMKGRVFDENFLMAIASLGAFCIDEKTEAVAVMIFYGVGELVQNMAVAKSRKNIAELMDICPSFAYVLNAQHEIIETKPELVKIGDTIVVRPGERIPLDGEVISGDSFLDTMALTGESVPRRVQVGSKVLSGSINQNSLLEIRVTHLFVDSTVAKILELVEHASSKKAKSEKFITKFARYYTPFVVIVGLFVAILPPLLGYGAFDIWLYRALTFLIISCPCALVLSIPISFFGGIGGAARHGILVKGGNYLEALNTIDTLVFDKTGTLTQGVFSVETIMPASSNITEEELLLLAAKAEAQSTHPIAQSILFACKANIHDKAITVTEIAGQGIIASFSCAENKNQELAVGNNKLMESLGIDNLPIFNKTTVYIAKNREYLGYITIADTLKEDVKESIEAIRATGIKKIIMLTGDNKDIAQDIAKELNLDEYHAELLPQDKVTELEKILQKSEKRVAFVGDGINDAPVLSRADIGFAMGGLGSDAAIEAADIVIMNDNIAKIATAFRIAQKTRSIVLQNIVFCLGVKAIIMLFAFIGITSIWFAIFADVGVALLALLNASRAIFVKQ